MATKSAADVYAELVERLAEAARAEPRVKALWLEAATREALRPPYASLEAHLAADEPDFAFIISRVESLAAGPGRRLEDVRWSDVPRFAREMRAVLDGRPFAVVVEQTPLLAKRPRTAVSALLDRTGHLYHVMVVAPPKAAGR